jgi:hypothetical protein
MVKSSVGRGMYREPKNQKLFPSAGKSLLQGDANLNRRFGSLCPPTKEVTSETFV